MAAQDFRVIFTQSAWDDLGEIVAYSKRCSAVDGVAPRAMTTNARSANLKKLGLRR